MRFPFRALPKGTGPLAVTILASALFMMQGCSSGSSGASAQKTAIQAYYVDQDEQKAAAEGKQVEDPSKVGPKSSESGNPSLKDLTTALDKAADAYVKDPHNAKAKEAYVVATVRLGTATMMADELDPKVKYRSALKLYRQALKVDPNNEEAKNNSEMIVDIYKSMHREVPN